ncbi:MAG: alpha-ribazole phosphatase [Rhodocyclales bacterium]|nr:alpha-ribazole phosphatase [Rhodocyclales bacterium]
MQLYLIRHPPPKVAAGLCYGATDLELADDVDATAAAVATLRTQLPPSLPVFSSPLQRCLALARALHPAPVSDRRLQEMDFGAWEMRAWDAIERRALDAWAADPLHYTPPGGESVSQMQQRVLDFLAGLEHLQHEAAALVTHAGVMKIISGHARHLPPSDWMQLRFAYGSVVRVAL